ncbi:MAG: protein kinase domain-containing protein, partial [Gemmataceae bacterium]
MDAETRFAGYRIRRRLGGGPFSDVYSATPNDSKKTVVIKTIRRNTPRPRAALRALEREAATLQAVRHPSIVELLETRLSAPEPFLVMKHDVGQTLRDQLRASGPTDATTAVHVIRQTAEALAAVHQAGRIHGDIKSDNLLRKSTGRVVVLDFGFSHAPGDHPACGGQFLLMGTPNT